MAIVASNAAAAAAAAVTIVVSERKADTPTEYISCQESLCERRLV